MLIVNWYSIFYWISVADGVKSFFDVASNLFSFGAVILFIVILILLIVKYGGDLEEDEKEDVNTVYKGMKKCAVYCLILALATWFGYIFCPNKKDALIIIAGGAVGNFVTKDSSARQIPSEVMTLLRDKIRSEIKEVNLQEAVAPDSLKGKTKEELIEIIKSK